MVNCKNKEAHYSWESMKRIYVRVSNTYYKDGVEKQERKFVPIGWICPECKEIKIDDPLPELKGNYGKFKHK